MNLTATLKSAVIKIVRSIKGLIRRELVSSQWSGRADEGAGAIIIV